MCEVTHDCLARRHRFSCGSTELLSVIFIQEKEVLAEEVVFNHKPESGRLLEDHQSLTARAKAFNTSINSAKEGEVGETKPARSPVVLQGAAQHEERQPDGSAEGQRYESCNGTRRAVRPELPYRLPGHPATSAPPRKWKRNLVALLPQSRPRPRGRERSVPFTPAMLAALNDAEWRGRRATSAFLPLAPPPPASREQVRVGGASLPVAMVTAGPRGGCLNIPGGFYVG